MKTKIIALLICTTIFLLSCQKTKSSDKCKDFRKNLTYLKNYKSDSTTTFLIKDIEQKIEFLENQSGIKANDKGNYLGRFLLNGKDFSNWENWLKNECSITN